MSRLAELEAAVESERAAAERVERAAIQAHKAAEEQRRRAEGPLAKAVDALERETGRALDRAQQLAAGAPLPSLDQRFTARRILLGTAAGFAPNDFNGPHELVNNADQAAAVLWVVVDNAQRCRREAERQLGGGHALTARADELECGAWRAYLTRLRQVAGETG